ncbi:hypothetical protein GC173_17190 [bacterium]|nr:hypothetical protein [bacterium]
MDPPNSRTGDLWGLTLRTLDPVEDWLLNDCRYHETAMIGAERGAFFIGDKEHVITAKADLLLVASELHRRLAGSDSPTSGKRRLPVESDSLLVLAEEGARMALELTHGHKRGTLPAPYFLPPVLDPPWVQLTQALLAIARLLTPGDSAEGAFVDLLFLVGGRGNANASPNRAFFPSRDEWLRKVAVKLGPRSTEEWLHLVLQAREAVDKSGFGGRNLPETIGKLGSAIEAIGENKRPRGSQLRWWVLWAEVATAWLSRATGASKSKCSSFVTCFLIENASDHPDPEFDGITTRRGLNSLMPDIAEQIPTDSSGRRGKPAKERILHDRSKWRCDKWKLGIAEDGSWPKDVNAGIALALALLDIRSPE